MSNALRRIVDEKDARACLASLLESGETLRAWSRRHAIDGRSLRGWEKSLSKQSSGGSTTRSRLVELVPTPTRTDSIGRYVIHVGALSIEVGADFDEAALRHLIEVVRSC